MRGHDAKTVNRCLKQDWEYFKNIRKYSKMFKNGVKTTFTMSLYIQRKNNTHALKNSFLTVSYSSPEVRGNITVAST